MNIKTIGIIGAGTMGNGIAQAFAAKGLPLLHEILHGRGVAIRRPLIALNPIQRWTVRAKRPRPRRDNHRPGLNLRTIAGHHLPPRRIGQRLQPIHPLIQVIGGGKGAACA